MFVYLVIIHVFIYLPVFIYLYLSIYFILYIFIHLLLSLFIYLYKLRSPDGSFMIPSPDPPQKKG